MSQLIQSFVQECNELLEEMESALLNLEADPDDQKEINALFRAMHTIKGSAGVFDFDRLSKFAHHMESAMELVRSGERRLDADLAALLLSCKDHIALLLTQSVDGAAESDITAADDKSRQLIDQLTNPGSRTEEEETAHTPGVPTPVAEVEAYPSSALVEDASRQSGATSTIESGINADLDSAAQVFVQECRDLLNGMEQALLVLESDPKDLEQINLLFRAMHTIKGSAGVFGFDDISSFAHQVESRLEGIRSGKRFIDSHLCSNLLSCKDQVALLLDQSLSARTPSVSEEMLEQGRELIARLDGSVTTAGIQGDQKAGDVSTKTEPQQPATAENLWCVSITFTEDAYRNGIDPLSFLHHLSTMGKVISLLVLDQRFPLESAPNMESCYLDFLLLFQSTLSKQNIREIFDYAGQDCRVELFGPEDSLARCEALLKELSPEQRQLFHPLLLQHGFITDPTQGPLAQPKPSREEEEKRVESPRPVAKSAQKSAAFIRVDSARLGSLINLVGELVIANAGVGVLAKQHGLRDIEEAAGELENLVGEIRESALQLRMVPIGETFSRYRRVVRDLNCELGKEVELQISGGETELDKTLVERISDPLMHLVRNAMDHGIEDAETRQRLGKPGKGVIHLNAYHDSGSVVIEISDDGKGLDAATILAKAQQAGLVGSEQNLSSREIFQLIFAPGLSTKQQVSTLSGRGVGMDVVKQNIEALRGSVELFSEKDQGIKVEIRMPLTLAIIDGFMVGVGNEHYVIPLSMVAECVELSDESPVEFVEQNYMSLHEEVLPYIRLREFLGQSLAECEAEGERPIQRESIVVVRCGRERAGLVVDELYGELQTVIKPLGSIFQRLEGISGATVLGSGEVAMILDVPSLTRIAKRQGPGRKEAGQGKLN
ncbi:MAG: chemotaxis protein CheA [Candidatus Sedimenticola sp. (ex Thyasira tokunagai)]